MKALLLACAIFLFAGCMGMHSSNGNEWPPGKLLASIAVKKYDFGGTPKGDTGFYFYLENASLVSGTPRHILVCYEFRNGRIVNIVSSGLEWSDVEQSLSAIDLQPFDYAQEVSNITEQLKQEENRTGISKYPPLALHGDEYEITIMTRNGVLVFNEWNPDALLGFYSKYSDKMAKLNEVLNVLAHYFGRGSML